jgi:hypothetical protein
MQRVARPIPNPEWQKTQRLLLLQFVAEWSFIK